MSNIVNNMMSKLMNNLQNAVCATGGTYGVFRQSFLCNFRKEIAKSNAVINHGVLKDNIVSNSNVMNRNVEEVIDEVVIKKESCSVCADCDIELCLHLRLPSDEEFEKNKKLCIENSYAYCEFCGNPHSITECTHAYIQDYKNYIVDFLSLLEDAYYELSELDYIHLLVLSTILDCPCVGVKTKNKMIHSIVNKIEVVRLYSSIVPNSGEIFQKVFDKQFSFVGFRRLSNKN